MRIRDLLRGGCAALLIMATAAVGYGQSPSEDLIIVRPEQPQSNRPVAIDLANSPFGREGYEYELVDVGTFHETADGGVTYHYTTSRGRHKVTWVGITPDEKEELRRKVSGLTI